MKKLIVATKEGGAITGEERIREHLDHLYGALAFWEGRPAKYQIDRIEVLDKELGEAARCSTRSSRRTSAGSMANSSSTSSSQCPRSASSRVRTSSNVAIESVQTLGADCGGGADKAATERN